MELVALGLLYPTRPILVVGPRTPPIIFSDPRHPLTPRQEDRIALWFQGSHYELITSEIPEWLWQQVWMQGGDDPTEPTNIPPVIEVAHSIPDNPPGQTNITGDGHPGQQEEGPHIRPPTEAASSHPSSESNPAIPDLTSAGDTRTTLPDIARQLSPQKHDWWLKAPLHTVGALLPRILPERAPTPGRTAIQILSGDPRSCLEPLPSETGPVYLCGHAPADADTPPGKQWTLQAILAVKGGTQPLRIRVGSDIHPLSGAYPITPDLEQRGAADLA